MKLRSTSHLAMRSLNTIVKLTGLVLCACTSSPTRDSAARPKVTLDDSLFATDLSEDSSQPVAASDLVGLGLEWVEEFSTAPGDKTRVQVPKKIQPFEYVERTVDLEPGSVVADSQQAVIIEYRRALQAFDAHDYELSVRLFGEFADRFPDHFYADGAEFKVAQCYAAMGDLSLASLLLENWLHKNPHSMRMPEVLVERAMLDERLGQARKARRIYRDVMQRFIDNPQAVVASKRLALLDKGARDATN